MKCEVDPSGDALITTASGLEYWVWPSLTLGQEDCIFVTRRRPQRSGYQEGISIGPLDNDTLGIRA